MNTSEPNTAGATGRQVQAGTSRCDVRATGRSVRWRYVAHPRPPAGFRRLTLRSATGTAQRAVPTRRTALMRSFAPFM